MITLMLGINLKMQGHYVAKYIINIVNVKYIINIAFSKKFSRKYYIRLIWIIILNK